MHFTFFALKRTFLQAMHKVQVPMMQRVALTPARFDLMFVLQRLRGDAGMDQSTISRWLGVSRQAVFKVVIALEKLGFVRRKRPKPSNRRRVYVLLTKVGRVVLRRAMKKLAVRNGGGPAERAARTVFVKRWWSKPCSRMEFRRTETYFTRLRGILDDRATLHYDWDPSRKVRYLAYRREPPRLPAERSTATQWFAQSIASRRVGRHLAHMSIDMRAAGLDYGRAALERGLGAGGGGAGVDAGDD